MIIFILFMLILLIAVFAVGLAIGSRNSLPPASNHSSLNERKNQKNLVSANNTTRTKPLPSVQSLPSVTAQSLSFQTFTQQLKSAPTVIQPIVRTPIIVEPDNSVITITPAPVVQIKPTIAPSQSVVIRPQEIVTVIASTDPVAVVSPSQAVRVEPPQRGAWDERGWIRQTDNRREIYEGFYTVGNRRFQGRIEARTRGHNVSAYIYEPPPEIKNHPHGACFQQVRDGWFILHWARAARNVDDAILYMERVLDESLNG